VHIGASPKRDGLTSCVRRSVVALEPGQKVPSEQKYWQDLIGEAYRVGHKQFIAAVRDIKQAETIEKAIVDFLASKNAEVSRRVGHAVNMPNQKPYSSVHNGGYTECQEFYGAVTLGSKEPLGHHIVNMLDVALRGCGSRWDEIVIPDLDFVIVENTYSKSGSRLQCLSSLPEDCQPLVGTGVG